MIKSKNKTEILVRAVIQDGNKVLVCKKLNKRYFFFPGGHLEFGESAKDALARELKEELGVAVKKCSFIGGSEHTFVEDGIKHHEINLAFDTSVKKINTKSQENHLKFLLLDKNSLVKEKVLPLVLAQAIFRWFKNKKPFWVSEKWKKEIEL